MNFTRKFLLFHFIFFLTSPPLFCQHSEREANLNYYNWLINQAKTYKLKSVTILSSKSEGKKQWITYKADYDENGNLIQLFDHNYKKPKHYETVYFKYDDKNRISHYTQTQSFNKKFRWTYNLVYDELDSVESFEEQTYYKNELNSNNALYLGRSSNNKISWTVNKRDTLYTFYNTQDSIIGRSYDLKDRYSDKRQWNSNGCMIGFEPTIGIQKIILRDSACRNLGYRTERVLSEIWVPYNQDK